MFNLKNTQSINNSNVDLTNKQQVENRDSRFKLSDADLRRAQAMSNAYTGSAQTSTANADRTASTYAGIGAGAATAYGSYMQNQNAEAAAKRNYDQQERANKAYYGNSYQSASEK
jgi:uncharacterized protein YjbI with pentapeptide repeats